ncbi:MAG: hypothetical protein JWN65_1673 [Solirubrobacterales bacterium]|nr:hypothetical protein [Solirubrobacterales bacterium]
MRRTCASRTVLAIACIAAVSATASASAAEGQLDETFAGDGTAWLTVDDGRVVNAPLVVPGPSGTTVLAAPVAPAHAARTRAVTTNSVLVRRLLDDGSADPAFNAGQPLLLPIAARTIVAAGVDASGAITLVVDDWEGATTIRLTPAGVVDLGYDGATGGAGYVRIATPAGCSSIVDGAVRPDGAVVLAWSGCNGALTRGDAKPAPPASRLSALLADGTPDEGFGTPAVTAGASAAFVSAIDLDPQGNVIVLSDVPSQLAQHLGLARLDTSGVQSTTFGVTDVAGRTLGVAGDVDVSADGRHIIASRTTDAAPALAAEADRPSWEMVSYDNTTGRRDPAFGTDGVARVFDDRLTSSGPPSVLSFDDGRAIAAQQTREDAVTVLRTTATGALDPSFGSGGIGVVAYGGAVRFGPPSLRADHKVLLSVWQPPAQAQARTATSRRLRGAQPTGGAVGVVRLKGPVPAPPSGSTLPAGTTASGSSAGAASPLGRTCGSKRVIAVHLRTGRTRRDLAWLKVRSVKVTVNGHSVPVVNNLYVKVDLRGRPFGTVTVKARIRLSNGRTVKDQRAFRTCRDGQSDRPAPGYTS